MDETYKNTEGSLRKKLCTEQCKAGQTIGTVTPPKLGLFHTVFAQLKKESCKLWAIQHQDELEM